MVNVDPIKILGSQLGIDFEQETFSAVIHKLAASGMSTFRLNWQHGMFVCMCFDEKACKALNNALDCYLENLEKSL